MTGLFVFGLALQMWNIYFGSILVFLGILMSFTSGISNKPPTFKTCEGEWETVTMEEFEKLKSLMKKAKKWASHPLNGASCLGFLVIIGMIGVMGILYFLMLAISHDRYFALVFFIDGAVVIVLLMLVGGRKLYRPQKFFIKVKSLDNIIQFLKYDRKKDVAVEPVFYVLPTNDENDVPTDARLMLKFEDAPEDFIGIQVQVNVNEVGSQKFPYLYTVLLGKKGFDFGRLGRRRSIANMIDSFGRKYAIEAKKTSEVDVLVFRQYTTKKSGYHTKPVREREIVSDAIKLARTIFREKNK